MSTPPDRRVTIPNARLQPWIAGFTARHGRVISERRDDRVQLAAADGARALVQVPFPPLPAGDDLVEPLLIDTLLAHVLRARRVGAFLVRKGGFAVGVFDGSELVASKTGSAYVQGRTKAGGWSQQRYARRRDNQSRKAYEEAADQAVRILLPYADQIEVVLAGGDQAAVGAVFADSRLAPLTAKLSARVYPVPDPRLRVLQAFPEQFLTVEIDLNELA